MIYVFGLILLMVGGIVYWATRPDEVEVVEKVEVPKENVND